MAERYKDQGLVVIGVHAPEFAFEKDIRNVIRIRFHARDLHLVLGLSKTDKPVRFRITIDGREPGGDADANGNGVVTEERLYQLVRQGDGITDRVFEIEFLDPGA